MEIHLKLGALIDSSWSINPYLFGFVCAFITLCYVVHRVCSCFEIEWLAIVSKKEAETPPPPHTY